ALVYVTLGRRQLVWGGHPAITPMILVVAQDMGVNYGSWVKLYQSQHFKEEYPEDNARFQNVVYTEAGNDRDESLTLMRRRMLKEQQFDAAVFVGGMKGIIDEFVLFRQEYPNATWLPVLSAGGAARDLGQFLPTDRRSALFAELDYVSLFHNE